MIGFCCATPYHLLLTLHMAKYEFEREEKCLIVCNHFVHADDVVEKIKKLAVFKVVVLVRNKRSGKWSNWIRRAHFVCFYEDVNKICKKYYFKKFIFFY